MYSTGESSVCHDVWWIKLHVLVPQQVLVCSLDPVHPRSTGMTKAGLCAVYLSPHTHDKNSINIGRINKWTALSFGFCILCKEDNNSYLVALLVVFQRTCIMSLAMAIILEEYSKSKCSLFYE